MQPVDFITALGRHYSKRHQTELQQLEWTREMIGVVTGADPKVLQRAYEIIRDEYDERAFPLPAVLKRYVARAADQINPDDARGTGKAENRFGPVRSYKDPAFEHKVRLAQEWQNEIIEKYKSWAGYWEATKHSKRVW